MSARGCSGGRCPDALRSRSRRSCSCVAGVAKLRAPAAAVRGAATSWACRQRVPGAGLRGVGEMALGGLGAWSLPGPPRRRWPAVTPAFAGLALLLAAGAGPRAGASARASSPASLAQSVLSAALARGLRCGCGGRPARRRLGPRAARGPRGGVGDRASPAAVYATVLAYTELPARLGGLERAVSALQPSGWRRRSAALLERRVSRRRRCQRAALAGSAFAVAPGALPDPPGHRVGGDRPRATARSGTVHRRLHGVLLRDRARPQHLPGGHVRRRLVEVHRLPGPRPVPRRGRPLLHRLQPHPGTRVPRWLPVRQRRLQPPAGRLQPLPLRPVQHADRREPPRSSAGW